MSYGYEPPKQDKGGSWGEVFAITRIAFGLLLPFLGAMIGLLLLVVLTIVLFAQHPALALLVLIPIAAGIYYLIRRERLAHEDEVDRLGLR